MADSENQAPSPMTDTRKSDPKPRWGLRIGLGAAALVLLAIVYLVVRLFLPVWWATRIGNQMQGSITSGILLGLIYGFVFTFVPLLIVWQARYKKVSWPWKALIVLVAVLVAIPNLLTLSIYANSSSSAAKARTMIDTSATWFPSWSIGGAIAGLVLFVGIAAFWQLWHSRGKKMKAMKSDIKARGTAQATASNPELPKTPDRPAPISEAGQGDAQLPPMAPGESPGGSNASS
ncbi:hypothetical protein DQ353_00490 [Arthrobacter sp. AQ5-05]|uniref:hypothetical protein n=1 Tax=Arthrobacter sp. AQ5-05 TaxID=2184581 RepID=UPI000DCC845B|nr:hypothetical protein [Arthrobacter sp. AQ5-05]RAX50911.1 hypothetical protein DQ353_00490 [Arthrobacter sp. AQ5-05]